MPITSGGGETASSTDDTQQDSDTSNTTTNDTDTIDGQDSTPTGGEVTTGDGGDASSGESTGGDYIDANVDQTPSTGDVDVDETPNHTTDQEYVDANVDQTPATGGVNVDETPNRTTTAEYVAARRDPTPSIGGVDIDTTPTRTTDREYVDAHFGETGGADIEVRGTAREADAGGVAAPALMTAPLGVGLEASGGELGAAARRLEDRAIQQWGLTGPEDVRIVRGDGQLVAQRTAAGMQETRENLRERARRQLVAQGFDPEDVTVEIQEQDGQLVATASIAPPPGSEPSVGDITDRDVLLGTTSPGSQLFGTQPWEEAVEREAQRGNFWAQVAVGGQAIEQAGVEASQYLDQVLPEAPSGPVRVPRVVGADVRMVDLNPSFGVIGDRRFAENLRGAAVGAPEELGTIAGLSPRVVGASGLAIQSLYRDDINPDAVLTTRESVTAQGTAGERAATGALMAPVTTGLTIAGGAAAGRAVGAGSRRLVGRARTRGRTEIPLEDLVRERVRSGEETFPMYSERSVPDPDSTPAGEFPVEPAADPLTEYRRLADEFSGPFEERGVYHATDRGFPQQAEFEMQASPRPYEPEAGFFAPEASPNFFRVGSAADTGPSIGLPRLGILDRPTLARVVPERITRMPDRVRGIDAETSYLQRQRGTGEVNIRSGSMISPEAEALVAGSTDELSGVRFSETNSDFYTVYRGQRIPIEEFEPILDELIASGDAPGVGASSITARTGRPGVSASRVRSRPPTTVPEYEVAPVPPGGTLFAGGDESRPATVRERLQDDQPTTTADAGGSSSLRDRLRSDPGDDAGVVSDPTGFSDREVSEPTEPTSPTGVSDPTSSTVVSEPTATTGTTTESPVVSDVSITGVSGTTGPTSITGGGPSSEPTPLGGSSSTSPLSTTEIPTPGIPTTPPPPPNVPTFPSITSPTEGRGLADRDPFRFEDRALEPLEPGDRELTFGWLTETVQDIATQSRVLPTVPAQNVLEDQPRLPFATGEFPTEELVDPGEAFAADVAAVQDLLGAPDVGIEGFDLDVSFEL